MLPPWCTESNTRAVHPMGSTWCPYSFLGALISHSWDTPSGVWSKPTSLRRPQQQGGITKGERHWCSPLAAAASPVLSAMPCHAEGSAVVERWGGSCWFSANSWALKVISFIHFLHILNGACQFFLLRTSLGNWERSWKIRDNSAGMTHSGIGFAEQDEKFR